MSYCYNKSIFESKILMEPEFTQGNQQSREEEVKLARSVKKFKDSSGAKPFSQPRHQVSYRDTLIGDIPGAFA